MTETTDRRAQRIAKMERLREQGIDPYPARPLYPSPPPSDAAYEAPQGDAQWTSRWSALVAVR